MVGAIAVLLGLILVGWLVWRAVKKRAINAHMVMYGLSCASGIFALVFFLNMDLDKMIKILVSIVLGAALILLAATIQRRQLNKAD